MPATSKVQRIVAAIAAHHPEKLYRRNRGMLAMSKGQLHEFASTKEKGLPAHTSMASRLATMRREGKFKRKARAH